MYVMNDILYLNNLILYESYNQRAHDGAFQT